MYSISFRIPIFLLGTTQYVNGSALSAYPIDAKKYITVETTINQAVAEVIMSAPTTRTSDTFKWKIV